MDIRYIQVGNRFVRLTDINTTVTSNVIILGASEPFNEECRECRESKITTKSKKPHHAKKRRNWER